MELRKPIDKNGRGLVLTNPRSDFGVVNVTKTLRTFLLSNVNSALRSVAFPSDKDLIDAEMLAFAREFYREVPFFRQMPLTQAFDLLGIKWALGVQRKSQYRKECIRLNVELTNPQTKELLEVNILDMHRTC